MPLKYARTVEYQRFNALFDFSSLTLLYSLVNVFLFIHLSPTSTKLLDEYLTTQKYSKSSISNFKRHQYSIEVEGRFHVLKSSSPKSKSSVTHRQGEIMNQT
mmetsp:Transcript_18165/g.20637  ORF Transcript_18165/g.20637 Transcript_18165/m.20637 type:complete len:102 (-) Transcript_18165:2-307(-)